MSEETDRGIRDLVEVIHVTVNSLEGRSTGPSRVQELWTDVGRQVDERLGVDSASRQIDALQREVEQLRRENAELARETATAGAPADVGAGAAESMDVGEFYRALGVPEDYQFDDDVYSESLTRVLALIANFFHRNRGNLVHVFSHLEIPVQLRDLGELIRESFDETEKVGDHLDDVRVCWKALVGVTWNGLAKWCEKIQEDLSPESIERISESRRQRPWDVYRDMYARLALFENLAETLRSGVKNELRQKAPKLLK